MRDVLTEENAGVEFLLFLLLDPSAASKDRVLPSKLIQHTLNKAHGVDTSDRSQWVRGIDSETARELTLYVQRSFRGETSRALLPCRLLAVPGPEYGVGLLSFNLTIKFERASGINTYICKLAEILQQQHCIEDNNNFHVSYYSDEDRRCPLASCNDFLIVFHVFGSLRQHYRLSRLLQRRIRLLKAAHMEHYCGRGAGGGPAGGGQEGQEGQERPRKRARRQGGEQDSRQRAREARSNITALAVLGGISGSYDHLFEESVREESVREESVREESEHGLMHGGMRRWDVRRFSRPVMLSLCYKDGWQVTVQADERDQVQPIGRYLSGAVGLATVTEDE